MYERIDNLEKKLSADKMSDEKRKLIKTEIREMRKLLNQHENQLAHLRTHNRKTFAFTVVLLFICFFMYVLYVLVGGKDF